MAKSQSSSLRSHSLEPISRCKMNKFFQLAVDATALKLATVTLQHLQEFPYPADHAGLWLLFYVLSSALFSDSCPWFSTAGSASRAAKPFSFQALCSWSWSTGRGQQPSTVLHLARGLSSNPDATSWVCRLIKTGGDLHLADTRPTLCPYSSVAPSLSA